MLCWGTSCPGIHVDVLWNIKALTTQNLFKERRRLAVASPAPAETHKDCSWCFTPAWKEISLLICKLLWLSNNFDPTVTIIAAPNGEYVRNIKQLFFLSVSVLMHWFAYLNSQSQGFLALMSCCQFYMFDWPKSHQKEPSMQTTGATGVSLVCQGLCKDADSPILVLVLWLVWVLLVEMALQWVWLQMLDQIEIKRDLRSRFAPWGVCDVLGAITELSGCGQMNMQSWCWLAEVSLIGPDLFPHQVVP